MTSIFNNLCSLNTDQPEEKLAEQGFWRAHEAESGVNRQAAGWCKVVWEVQ